ncbi:hypothetical protein FRX31_032545 [Thalictrum thalictroides]|uniref:Reverse transcriptase zinc-binding domain-containing protein n=1 Tax=Thalictrum thalictroides TaxID=46969 RepID=A0A7J6UZJ9_THATH|nr:hypothetical protein FRX31_032545 [Thalictrum thalictroides]
MGLISDMATREGDATVWNLHLRRELFEWEKLQMEKLMEDLQNSVFEGGEDRWGWKWSRKGIYTVKSMYKELWRERQSEQEPHLISMEFPWKKRLPLKIKFFLWTAYLDRILTNCNLIKRGRAVDPICSACRLSNEDVTHLFLHCSKTLEVWEYLLRPRDSFYANIFAADSIEEWINAWPVGPTTELGTKIWELLPFATVWILWKCRNCRIFQSKEKMVEAIVVEIKGTIWYWLGIWTRRNHYRFQDLLLNWEMLLKVP